MAPTIMCLNDQLELRDRRIRDFEAKIVDLESKMTALSERNWTQCTLPNSRFSHRSELSLDEGLNFVCQEVDIGDNAEDDSDDGDQK